MKTTIDKTITVLEKLMPKYINLGTKLNEAILSEEENSTLNIKLDEILALVNSNSSGESGTDIISDLVSLGILPKQISEFTDDDIGTIISIPYTDSSGKILLNNGCIEFEVVGVNHHRDINDESKPTITLISKDILRYTAFDAKESNNPLYIEDSYPRADYGNCRWSMSNIRQWLNSENIAGKWFTPQHDYDEAPNTDNIDSEERGAYVNDSGFLVGFNNTIKQHFATIKNKTVLCNPDKDLLSKDFEETEDKVFLLSYTEIGLGDLDKNNPEGRHLTKFNDESSRMKYNNGGWYWLRSPDVYYACDLYCIDNDGLDNISNAYYGNIGIAPVIVLC